MSLIRSKGYTVNRSFAEYLVLRAYGRLDSENKLSDQHALLRYKQSLQTQICEQEVALTQETKDNSVRMSQILQDPHFADIYDMAVRDPKNGSVRTHDGGNHLYRKIADTTMADMLHAQKTTTGLVSQSIKTTWCSLPPCVIPTEKPNHYFYKLWLRGVTFSCRYFLKRSLCLGNSFNGVQYCLCLFRR